MVPKGVSLTVCRHLAKFHLFVGWFMKIFQWIRLHGTHSSGISWMAAICLTETMAKGWADVFCAEFKANAHASVSANNTNLYSLKQRHRYKRHWKQSSSATELLKQSICRPLQNTISLLQIIMDRQHFPLNLFIVIHWARGHTFILWSHLTKLVILSQSYNKSVWLKWYCNSNRDCDASAA